MYRQSLGSGLEMLGKRCRDFFKLQKSSGQAAQNRRLRHRIQRGNQEQKGGKDHEQAEILLAAMLAVGHRAGGDRPGDHCGVCAGMGMGCVVWRGAGVLRAFLPDALVGGRQPCIYTLSLCRGGFATCSGVKNKTAVAVKPGEKAALRGFLLKRKTKTGRDCIGSENGCLGRTKKMMQKERRCSCFFDFIGAA